jgi:ComF family protein
LRRLKFEPRPDIARTLAPLIAPAIAEAAGGVDVAMPVPLHWRRMWQRGFNQAALLLECANTCELEVDKLSLRRRRATTPQTGLSAKKRAANVDGAFVVPESRRPRVAGRHILLCDDIMTTGATFAAATRALLRAGARQVTCFSAARAEMG